MQIRAWNWKKYAQRHKMAGEHPGTLVAHPEAQATRLDVIAYGPDGVVEESGIESLDLVQRLVGKHRVLWVNVDGLGTADVIKGVGEIFGLHVLALEDVMSIRQRPKVEIYGEHVFVVTRMTRSGSPLMTEQFSLFLGPGFVVTFQEQGGDVLDPVRQRIRSGRPKMRDGEADYLAYALLDAVLDAYFPILEEYGEFLEDLEQDILSDPRPEVVPRLHHLKRDLLNLRRYVWPLREVFNILYRDELPHIKAETRVYLRDCHDHTIQLMDLVESYRDVGTGLMDFYLSSVSNRMNEVMKVLTIIATLFIPLGFIASVYGMNFDTASPWNMPELGWRYGYFFALGIMLAVALLLLFSFWRRGWLGGSGHGRG